MSNETATDSSMQDITARLEAAMASEEALDTSTVNDEDTLDTSLPSNEDAELPPSVDSDENEDDQEEDELDDIANPDEEDLTIASLLGVEEDRISVDEDSGDISILTKIDGEDRLVPVKELAASFQLQGHVNNKSMALESERKEFEQVRSETIEQLKTRIEGTVALSKVLEDEIVSEYKSIDWDALRRENPSEWTALRQEYSERAQRIQQAQKLASDQLSQVDAEAQQEMVKKFEDHLSYHKGKVIESHPEWADENKFREGVNKINDFLKSTYQFTDDELRALNDHRLISVIEDAMSFRNGLEKAVSKRRKDLPKFQKPGESRQNAANLAKARTVKAQRKKVRDGGGKVNDVASLIVERM